MVERRSEMKRDQILWEETTPPLTQKKEKKRKGNKKKHGVKQIGDREEAGMEACGRIMKT